MTEHVITVDVYAHWGEKPPKYRVFVDNNLLTERDFLWSGSDTYVRENIIVNLEAGPHQLLIQQINTDGVIQPKNVTIDGVASSMDFVTQ